MTATADDVLAFWFGTDPDATRTAKSQEHLWWSGAPQVDADIRSRFAALHADAVAGRLRAWLATPRGRLAAIIVVDQFSRSLFRGGADAFAHHDLARGWCLEGLMLRQDRTLAPLERLFFWLPLEHSERLEDQQRSAALNEALVDDVPAAERDLFNDFASFASGHRDLVARFGRFPARNAALGRESTAEERAWIAAQGAGGATS